jgi:hypothetical protein
MALGLLLPVPALALTFTSSWQAVTNTLGGPTPPEPTFTDVTNKAENVDHLSVDMGAYQGSTASAASTIDLTRTFSIDDSQRIELQDRLLAQFQNAGEDISVSIKNSAGTTVATPIKVSLDNPSDQLKTLRAFENGFSNLKPGDYTLDVAIRYFTNNKVGGWKSISEHHKFDFEGGAK